jgi:hypothetical protein
VRFILWDTRFSRPRRFVLWSPGLYCVLRSVGTNILEEHVGTSLLLWIRATLDRHGPKLTGSAAPFSKCRWNPMSSCVNNIRVHKHRVPVKGFILCSRVKYSESSITMWWHNPARRKGKEVETPDRLSLLRTIPTQKKLSIYYGSTSATNCRTHISDASSELNCLLLIFAVSEYGFDCSSHTRKLPWHVPSHCNRALTYYTYSKC